MFALKDLIINHVFNLNLFS